MKIFYTFSVLIILICVVNHIYAQADSGIVNAVENKDSIIENSTKRPEKEKYSGVQFLRIGVDAKAIVFPLMYPGKTFAEVTLDYKYRDKTYLATEAGWGNGNYDYPHLNYKSKGMYARVGLDNSLLTARHIRDYDKAFVGFRYGMGLGNRTEATYTFESPFGGQFSDQVPAERYFIHWGEITAGMKLEVLPRTFIGWTGRAKFLFNKNSFKTIKPQYLAGYGNADKTTSFDAGFYLQYILFTRK